jgi:C4-dicarboxylate-specific signal transduction histidine kinase
MSKFFFSDDGCAMGPNVRRKAFDPFFTTHRDQGSTGLGLHIVYNVVIDCLGGQLKLDSKSEGTKIQLILPRVAPGGVTSRQGIDPYELST